jgi:hypothetical protein
MKFYPIKLKHPQLLLISVALLTSCIFEQENTNGKMIFWTQTDISGSSIEVYTSGQMVGETTAFSPNGIAPDCGTAGYLTLEVIPETIAWSATRTWDNTTWSGMTLVGSKECKRIELIDSQADTGQVIFWVMSDFCGTIDVISDFSSYIVDGSFPAGAPNCGAVGGATITFFPGDYEYSAYCNGHQWIGSFTIVAGTCKKIQLI